MVQGVKMKSLAFLFAFAFPILARAQDSGTIVLEPGSVDQALGVGALMIQFFQEGKILAAAAMLTLVLVFVFRQFIMPKLKLASGVLPLVSAVTGVIAGAAIALASGARPAEAMLALMAGPAASTFWDALAKYLIPKPEEPKA